MTKALLRNTFREIANTKARFISIMAIIALGVGFFAGIKATSPSMYRLAETYYRDSRLMDFRLVSTTGFAEEDIKAVEALEGVKSVMPSYFCDVMTDADDGGDVVRIIAVPKAYDGNEKLNLLNVTDGRAPRKSGEIVTESVAFANIRHKIGMKISLNPVAGDNKLSDILNTTEFTVVGKAESPLYISYQRGTTTIGDGKIDEYMYVSAEDYKVPQYTELYVKAEFSDKVSAFSDDYEKKSDEMKQALESLSREREKAFTAEVIPNAHKRLGEARAEYNEKKAEAEGKLGDALKKINEGKAEYNSKIGEAEKSLEAAREQIESGEAALASGEEEYASAIASAEEMLADGKAQLDSAEQQFNESKAAFQEQLEESRKAAAGDDLAKTQTDVMDAIGSAQLGSAQSKIYSGSAQLAVGESELAVQRLNGQQKLSAAGSQLSAARQKYESGVVQLQEKKQSGKKELDAARAEYEKAKAEADEKLAEGLKEIEKNEKALNDFSDSESKWYVFTRSDNPGYATYSLNADRLDAVASVFPLFFLLVAVLVCVTTMTRLIEEKRTEIATLKALGYGNTSIILKYVIYSLIAAVAGSAVGIAAGLATLPHIIYDAYKIMFYIGDITLVPHVPSIVLGIAAAVACTSVVSIIVCLKSLKIKPARGMRPKAPKAGKRIILEHITPLWKHMGFTAKLTARNLFRYKVRLCMTVIGVAGCTALIVAAFGLLNSFEPLTHEQFGSIFKYDAAVIPKSSGSSDDLKYIKELAESTDTVSASMLALQEEAVVEFNGHKTTESTYLSVMEDPDSFDEIISLHTRKDKTPLKLNDDTVMINEKLASDFGFSAGDVISVTSDSGTAEIKVGGIYEQYIYNYVFMTPNCYKKLFDRDLSFNIYQVRLSDKSDATGEKFSSAMLADSRVVAVAFMDQNVDDFRNMLNSLDMVVVVMIVCAAALAFVVLYNLTNINLAERQREIATFKVLGFYNRETSRFIYIENIILTFLGILVGLGLGVLLTGFIIRTVEVDNVMFGRDIYFTTYLYAAGLTMLFSLIVNVLMTFKIKSVNMVESLKSVE